MKFYHLVPRFVTSNQFNTTSSTIQTSGQQPDQCFIRSRIHRWRGDSDSQFVAGPIMRNDFVGRRARLEFYGNQDSICLCTEEIGKRRDRHFTSRGSFVLRIDKPERHGRQRASGKIGNQVNP